MRSVHTVGSLEASHGGPSRSVVHLCDALARAGAQVEIVTVRPGPGEATVRPTAAGVTVREVDAPGTRALLPGTRSAFGAAVEAAAGDGAGGTAVVHDHGMWLPTDVVAARAARRAGAPLVVAPKGMASAWAMGHRRAKKQVAWHLYQRQALAGAALVQATSEAEVEDIRRLGVRGPVALVRHGVAVPPSLPPAGPAAGRRQAVFLSRVHPKKGLPLLIEAWARVRPAGWELVVAGPDEGGHRAEVEALVHQAGLAADVRFVGPVEGADTWALLRGASLFVLPTHSENFGIAVAEALAAGVPVLTTHGAPWRVLETERCGWWVPVTADALAGALTDATSRPADVLQAMGRRGEAYAAAHLRWDRAAAEMLAAYRYVLGLGPRPAFVTLTADAAASSAVPALLATP